MLRRVGLILVVAYAITLAFLLGHDHIVVALIGAK